MRGDGPLLVKGMWDVENDFPRPLKVVSPGPDSGKGQRTTFIPYHEIFLRFLLKFASVQIITWQQKFLLYLYATYDIHTHTPLISRSWTGYIISTSLDKAEQIHGRVGRKKTMSKGTGNESRIFSCHIDITFIIHWKCWKFDTNSVLFNIKLTRLEYLGNSS